MNSQNRIPAEDVREFRELFRRRKSLESEYARRWEKIIDELLPAQLEWYLEYSECPEDSRPPEPMLNFESAQNESDYLKNKEERETIDRQLEAIRERLSRLIFDAPIVVASGNEDMNWFKALRDDTLSCDVDESFFEIFDEYYRPRAYARRKLSLSPIVTFVAVPSEIIKLLHESREAYCLGLVTSCVSLCRTLLEASIDDILIRTSAVRGREDIERQPFISRLFMVLSAKTPSILQVTRLTREVYYKTSGVIHSQIMASDDLAKEMLDKTQICVRDIYHANQRKLSQKK